MVFLGQSSAWRSLSLSRLFILTTAEIYDDCMACLGHEHMVGDSKSSFALAVDFFLEDFRSVVLCYHHHTNTDVIKYVNLNSNVYMSR